MKRVVFFITYTMAKPIVGGSFFRALRLAMEMTRRGWHPIIANWGPVLDDPKVSEANDSVQFVPLDRNQPGLTLQILKQEFSRLNPALVVMGETPFKAMELFYGAAKRLLRPFVVLDQFYSHELLPPKEGVDLILLYGLKSFWRDDLHLEPPYEIVPPFIERVTPKSDLPVPEELYDRRWITLVAYDDYVCKRGFDLLSRLEDRQTALIAITRNPESCRQIARSRGVDSGRLVTLPLQCDATVFGFMAASAVTLVSNGFLQIMEALALASPIIALERGDGVGMNAFNIAKRFEPYVSFEHSVEEQLSCMTRWLQMSPISPELRARLDLERHGLVICANRIEAVYRDWQTESKWRRTARRWWEHLLRIADYSGTLTI